MAAEPVPILTLRALTFIEKRVPDLSTLAILVLVLTLEVVPNLVRRADTLIGVEIKEPSAGTLLLSDTLYPVKNLVVWAHASVQIGVPELTLRTRNARGSVPKLTC